VRRSNTLRLAAAVATLAGGTLLAPTPAGAAATASAVAPVAAGAPTAVRASAAYLAAAPRPGERAFVYRRMASGGSPTLGVVGPHFVTGRHQAPFHPS
jgi:hypothetical protein